MATGCANRAPYDICVARSGYPDKTIRRMEHVLGAMQLLGKIRISFDEWNMRNWHHPSFLASDPNIAERDLNDDNSTYTMADAVFSARFLNTCLRHCSTVGMANFSPVVNTRGAIFTHKDGVVLRSTYHVFNLYANHCGSTVLDAYVESPSFTVEEQDSYKDRPGYEPVVSVPYVDAVATMEPQTGALSVAMINLHPEQAIECHIELPVDLAGRAATVFTLNGASTSSYNDVQHPDDIHVRTATLRSAPGGPTIELEPHSVTMVVPA